MSSTLPLEGRRALVTGSSRNLGAQIARSLARRGAILVVTYHASPGLAEALIEELREETGRDHHAVGADLSSPDGVDAMVDAAHEAVRGPLELLVNNHGPFSMTPLHLIPAAELGTVMDGNFTVALRAVQRVVPGMREAGWGRIVNLSAGSAYLRNHSVYGLAKTALGTLTESLALELGPEINVNAVAPGQIAESAEDIEDIDPTFVERAVARTPSGRLVTRAEVAEIVASLCTPPFDMLNGAVIPVDGGWRLNRF
ncbi:SDR family oxidoreductase [Nocardioides sp.]|uniref:SDR family NAD(P)-dependent oxidoreductase n=1 Tax=Nocardioides sp. TaxID=35761 RepID=UPI00261A860E|nr:SDR family oxidoreductase [Nocardioides sp.]MDI6908191.1 SDR family oxidoreductase [Nocardioides sp.]